MIQQDQLVYCTDDELRFLRGLQMRGRLDMLRKLRVAYRAREWSGPRMDVDSTRVMRWLDAALGKEHVAAHPMVLVGQGDENADSD